MCQTDTCSLCSSTEEHSGRNFGENKVFPGLETNPTETGLSGGTSFPGNLGKTYVNLFYETEFP